MNSPLEPRPTKILCVGRNYVEHAREFGEEVPEEPLFFLKPPSALVGSGMNVLVPSGAGQVDFEGEIAFQIGRRASHVREEDALECVSAVLPLNDVTCRDLQRRDGQWTRAKGFDSFCPVGAPMPIEGLDLGDLRVQTMVNGELRQDGVLSETKFSIQFLIAYISRVMTLEPGDLISTGTPSGVGPLVPWDDVEVKIPGVGSVTNPVRAAPGRPWRYGVGGASG